MPVAAFPEVYEAFLRVTAPDRDKPDIYVLELLDYNGNHGSGLFTLDLSRPYRQKPVRSRNRFLEDYTTIAADETEAVEFGRDLFRALIDETGLGETWQAVLAAAGDRPLALAVEFGNGTESMAALPLELLHDHVNFVFARPGNAIERSLLQTPAGSFMPPAQPRVLLAWACPPGSGALFDPRPHIEALDRVFGDLLWVLGDDSHQGSTPVHNLDLDQVKAPGGASIESLAQALHQASENGTPFDYLHILAHGWRDRHSPLGGVCLVGENGGNDRVPAQRLAGALRGCDLKLVFLCSCRAGVAGQAVFSGVAQQILAFEGGDVPCVAATQADLPVAGSAELGEKFYRLLEQTGHPAQALAVARRTAYTAAGGVAWSVPVLFSRRRRSLDRQLPVESSPLPPRLDTYLTRAAEEEGLRILGETHFLMLVGLPGVGKTELGKEIARGAKARGMCDRVIFQEVLPGFTTDQLRALLGTALGQTGVEHDRTLAALFERSGERILLVLDNAEDLMPDDARELAFRDQVTTLLGGTTRLQLLMTTRWPLSGTRPRPREMEVPPMTPEETEELLRRELDAAGVLREEWIGTDGWWELLAIIDGHPRSLWLISQHFDSPRSTPERVLERLRQFRDRAIAEPDLLGRADRFELLRDDQKARLRSLAATMDFSFAVLEERHPDAAELFLAFSLFPAGLPESIASEVAGGAGNVALDHLYRHHLVAWQNERAFCPVPLKWYAERKRGERQLDEARYMHRALYAFAGYCISCDRQILREEILYGVRRLLDEEQNLLALADWVRHHHEPSSERSLLAIIMRAVQNGFHVIDRVGAIWELAQAGLVQARRLGDRLGEAQCLHGLGDLKMRISDLEPARDDYRLALAIYQQIENRSGEANCLQRLGDLEVRAGDLDDAKADYMKAIDIFQQAGNRLGEANCLRGLGELKLRTGDLDQSSDDLEEALAIFRRIAHRLGEAHCLYGLGDLKMRTNDLEGAGVDYREALAIYEQIENRLGQANCLTNLGDLMRQDDDLDGARKNYEKALAIYRQIDNRLGEANCLQSIALVPLAEGRPTQTFALLLDVVEIFRSIGERLGEQSSLGYLARSAQEAGAGDQALLLAEASLAVGREIKDRHGQIRTLALQTDVWELQDEVHPFLAAMILMRELYREMRDEGGASEVGNWMKEAAKILTDEELRNVEADPETFRLRAIEEARKRFEASGRGLFDPLPEPGPDPEPEGKP